MTRKTTLPGMTVNERLLELGLMAKFDQALAAWDERALREFFTQIELPDYDLSQLRGTR